LQIVTLVKLLDCEITRITLSKTKEYLAIQVMFCDGSSPHYFGEFKAKTTDKYQLGQKLDLSMLALDQKIKVVGKCIGKGFSGSIKRHGFSRGPMTHGSKNHRLLGSIGAGTSPGRVFPGKKMAGRLGNRQVTQKSKIISIKEKNGILLLKGSLPGKRSTLLKLVCF
jgi:large subunit ribosomal protein L3